MLIVHWLRHIGISEDVKICPHTYVQDDAGHSLGAITDWYIDVKSTVRAQSVKNIVLGVVAFSMRLKVQ